MLHLAGLCVCVCVGQTGELCKNGWTDREMSFGVRGRIQLHTTSSIHTAFCRRRRYYFRSLDSCWRVRNLSFDWR